MPVRERQSPAELDALTATQAPAPDASLLDELPYAAANLTGAPEHVKAGLYNAFDIHALYRQPIKQATIWATITDDTPGTIAACSPTPAPTTTHLDTCRPPL